MVECLFCAKPDAGLWGDQQDKEGSLWDLESDQGKTQTQDQL